MNRIKDYAELEERIVLWLREYADNNNIRALVCGVSGGIDSAVVSNDDEISFDLSNIFFGEQTTFVTKDRQYTLFFCFWGQKSTIHAFFAFWDLTSNAIGQRMAIAMG